MKITILIDDKEVLINEVSGVDEGFTNYIQKELNSILTKVGKLKRRKKNGSNFNVKTS